MRFLVVGLGSMGKRRVRNLQAIGGHDIAGFDLRSDRRAEAADKYGIQTFDDYQQAVAEFKPQALVVSTPPDLHMKYATDGFERGLHSFVEASVNDAKSILALAEKSQDSGIVIAPSCTMRYFAGPKKVKELIRQDAIGTVLNYNYHTGQYLPDWHPWEDIKDFYVSKRETGGCREIVAFELTWLDDLFGNSQALAGVNTKVSDLDVDIDDIYHSLVKHEKGALGNITIEVLSRPEATRELRVLGSEGLLIFSGEKKEVRYKTAGVEDWTVFDLSHQSTVEAQYINPEEPYIEEMRAYVNACEARDQKHFPNTLQEDYEVLQTVYKLESLSAL